MIKIILSQKLGFDSFRSRGQVSIETAAAIIIAFIFILGTLQIFVWLNSMMANRQQYYQQSRMSAGSFMTPGVFNHTPQTLNIFQGAH